MARHGVSFLVQQMAVASAFSSAGDGGGIGAGGGDAQEAQRAWAAFRAAWNSVAADRGVRFGCQAVTVPELSADGRGSSAPAAAAFVIGDQPEDRLPLVVLQHCAAIQNSTIAALEQLAAAGVRGLRHLQPRAAGISSQSAAGANGSGSGSAAGENDRSSDAVLLQDVAEADVVCVSAQELVGRLAEMFGGCGLTPGAGARTQYDLDAIEYQARPAAVLKPLLCCPLAPQPRSCACVRVRGRFRGTHALLGSCQQRRISATHCWWGCAQVGMHFVGKLRIEADAEGGAPEAWGALRSVFRDDSGRAHEALLEDLRRRCRQEPLPAAVMAAIRGSITGGAAEASRLLEEAKAAVAAAALVAPSGSEPLAHFCQRCGCWRW